MSKLLRPVRAALLLATFAIAPAVAADKTVARIDGQPITDADIATLTNSLAQQLAQVPEDQRKKMVLNRLIDIRIIANQAAKDGLDQSEEFKRRIDQIRQQMLINEYVRAKVAASISDETLKARYDKEIASANLPDEIRASHVLVKTKDEALAVIKDLNAGGDFGKIAEDKSQDPGSAKNGGDLGFFSAGDMVKPFEDAALALKVGEYTKDPIETQFGFHVIKLVEKRKQQPPAFDEVKDQLRQDSVGAAFSAKLEELKKAAKVEIDDPALK